MADKLASQLDTLTASTVVSGDLFVAHDASAGLLKSITATELSKYLLARSSIYNVVDYGATGDGSTDDATAIQDAIDAAATTNGTVIIPKPTTRYLVGSTLDLTANVTLWAHNNAEIRITIDDELLRVRPNSKVIGGRWRNTYASMSQETAIIHLLSDSSTFFDRDEHCILSDMFISGPAAGTLGNGIKLEAGGSASTEAVQWVQANNITIDNAYKGIHLLCNEDSGDAASFVNGNSFTNVHMDHFVYGIYLDTTGTGTPACTGNMFANLQFETRGNMTNAIAVADAACERNGFVNIHVWDIGNGALGASTIGVTAPNMDSAREGNYFTNLRGLITTQVSLGTHNGAQPAIPAS